MDNVIISSFVQLRKLVKIQLTVTEILKVQTIVLTWRMVYINIEQTNPRSVQLMSLR